MDNIMNERFTAQEIDAIKAEADLDIKRPLVSLEEQLEKIRDLKVVGGDGAFWKRKYCVLSEALRLAKMGLQAANNELDVLREDLTCKMGRAKTLQETIDLQMCRLLKQDKTIENLEKKLSDGTRERASLNDVLENTLKQMCRLADADLKVIARLKDLNSSLNFARFFNWVLAGFCIALGAWIAFAR